MNFTTTIYIITIVLVAYVISALAGIYYNNTLVVAISELVFIFGVMYLMSMIIGIGPGIGVRRKL